MRPTTGTTLNNGNGPVERGEPIRILRAGKSMRTREISKPLTVRCYEKQWFSALL